MTLSLPFLPLSFSVLLLLSLPLSQQLFPAPLSSCPMPRGFHLPPVALQVGMWAQGALPVPLALLFQLGFCGYTHLKREPLPNAVGGT